MLLTPTARRALLQALTIVLLALAGGTAAADAPPIGRLTEIDAAGLPLDAGRWVHDGERPVIALDHRMELELIDGRVLRLDPNSALTVELVDDGVAVSVLSGRVRLTGPAGRERVGGAGGRFVLRPRVVGESDTDPRGARDDDEPGDDDRRRDEVRRALSGTEGD